MHIFRQNELYYLCKFVTKHEYTTLSVNICFLSQCTDCLVNTRIAWKHGLPVTYIYILVFVCVCVCVYNISNLYYSKIGNMYLGSNDISVGHDSSGAVSSSVRNPDTLCLTPIPEFVTGECIAVACIQERERFGGGLLMVLGCICYRQSVFSGNSCID